MRITIITQFYPPEPGAAAVRLGRLARLLAAQGHTVQALTSLPNYPEGIIPPRYRKYLFYKETIDGVKIHRVRAYTSTSKGTYARLLNQISFMLASALCGSFIHHPDVFLVESHPLFVCLTAGWLRRIKRAPVVLNVSDLWPESAVATGALRADSKIVKIAERVERWAYHDAAHIVGMTEGVVEGINKVHGRPERVTMIQNAVDLERFRPNLEAERAALRHAYGLDGKFVAVHVGNMSLTYDFDLILSVAAGLPEVCFLFVGGGSQAEYIKTQIAQRGLTNVIIAGVLPHQEMPGVWAAADVCLIALRDHSVAGGTRPAKMFEAMATGTPIVAAIRGEGAALLASARAGIATPIGDSVAMIEALRRLRAAPEQRQQMSLAGRAYAEVHLSPERVSRAYLEIFQKVTE